MSLTKSDLIKQLADRKPELLAQDVESVVRAIIEQLARCLSTGQRIEIRGFGSFSIRYRAPRNGRNPKTGETVSLPAKHVIHFKPGKELKERVNQSQAEIRP